MTNDTATPRRTLGDLSVNELIDSALSDGLALGNRLDRTEGISAPERLLINAYVGSVLARLSVAQDKLSG